MRSNWSLTLLLAVTTIRSSPSRGWLRRTLVGAQFAIAAGLIACTVVVRDQLAYMRSQDLGLRGEQVVVVQIGYPGVKDSKDLFVERLLLHEAVAVATALRHAPGTAPPESGVFAGPGGQSATLGLISADPGFLALFDIPLLAGTDLLHARDARGSWRNNEMILNRSAARALGFARFDDVVARQMEYDYRGQTRRGVVVGIMEDFHVESLHRPLQPMALTNEFPSAKVAARLDPVAPGLQHLRDTWSQMYPAWPLEFEFVDQAFERAYRQDERLG